MTDRQGVLIEDKPNDTLSRCPVIDTEVATEAEERFSLRLVNGGGYFRSLPTDV